MTITLTSVCKVGPDDKIKMAFCEHFLVSNALHLFHFSLWNLSLEDISVYMWYIYIYIYIYIYHICITPTHPPTHTHIYIFKYKYKYIIYIYIYITIYNLYICNFAFGNKNLERKKIVRETSFCQMTAIRLQLCKTFFIWRINSLVIDYSVYNLRDWYY